jgi:hypothetical protein
MNDDVKAAIDEIANSLQVINLLSTRLRQDLGESAQHAIDLAGHAGAEADEPRSTGTDSSPSGGDCLAKCARSISTASPMASIRSPASRLSVISRHANQGTLKGAWS